MVNTLINQNKVLELHKQSQVYLTFVESIISYDIIVCVGAFISSISQKCQNQIIRIFFDKEKIYSIKNVFTSMLYITYTYPKITAK